MDTARRACMFALIYTGLSLAVEIVLIVVFRLHVPRDNAVVAPVVLTVPPILTALVCGYRSLKPLALAAIAASVLTLGATMIVVRLTGKSTGLFEPIVSRSLAGALAGWLAAAAAGRRAATGNAGRAGKL